MDNFGYTFFYKEHLYKELEAEKGSKNMEFLRNLPDWNKSSNLRNTKEHKKQLKKQGTNKELWGSNSLKNKELQPQPHHKGL